MKTTKKKSTLSQSSLRKVAHEVMLDFIAAKLEVLKRYELEDKAMWNHIVRSGETNEYHKNKQRDLDFNIRANQWAQIVVNEWAKELAEDIPQQLVMRLWERQA